MTPPSLTIKAFSGPLKAFIVQLGGLRKFPDFIQTCFTTGGDSGSMSDDGSMSESFFQIPGQEIFELPGLDGPAGQDAASPSRRRRMIAGGAVLVTGLAALAWGASAVAGGGAAHGFPSVAALSTADNISATSAAAAVDKAVVDIVSIDGYSGNEDAGTGMVITSDGDVLTNNHVVADATAVRVTLVSTGQTYQAKVLGTDATDDVALLKLRGVSGLATIPVGDATSATAGIAVAAIGNALGKAGTPTVTTGTITGTGRSITASDGNGSASERLTGMLETNADIVSGDSGGPLVDSGGQVIGMDTAASSADGGNFGFAPAAITSSTDGYAIPITTALEIAKKIAAGDASSTIVIGTPGFLGLELGAGFGTGGENPTATSGLTVAGVLSNTPAASTGIAADDTITSLNGTPVASEDALSAALAKTHAGQRETLGWVDEYGTAHQSTLTLIAGPAA
jgi:S1-C subfamily serine protease